MEIQKEISLEKDGEIAAIGEPQKTELQGTMRSCILKAFDLAWIWEDYCSIIMSNQFKTILFSSIALKRKGTYF